MKMNTITTDVESSGGAYPYIWTFHPSAPQSVSSASFLACRTWAQFSLSVSYADTPPTISNYNRR